MDYILMKATTEIAYRSRRESGVVDFRRGIILYFIVILSFI